MRFVSCRLIVPLVCAGALLLPATSAMGAQRYASPGGTGPAATCPQANPCDLDTAVENAAVVNGDEVIVTPGTYSVAQLNVGAQITVHGQSGQPKPTINTSSLFGISMNAASSLRDLKTVNANQAAIYVGGGPSTIERVDASTTAGGAIVCWIAATVTVRDSICRSAATNTSGLGANSGLLAGNRAITLRNVTAVGTSAGLFLNYSGAGVNVTVDAKSVIASGPGYDIGASASGGSTIQVTLANSNYNQEFENGGATITNPGTGTGNQTALPQFVNEAGGDLHQLGTSPTVDAGVVDGSSGSTDFEGDARSLDGDGICPDDPVPDIGADEYSAGVPDCTPPDTSISSGPSGPTSDSTPTFGLASTEPGSTFECRLDGGAFAPCATPFTTAALSDGAHTLDVRATDPAANVDPSPASRFFSVDTAAPKTAFTAKPKVKSKGKKAKVKFKFKADDPATFACALDGAKFSGCTSPVTAKVPKGKHTFAVRATDSVGNVEAAPATTSFTVKRKRPKR